VGHLSRNEWLLRSPAKSRVKCRSCPACAGGRCNAIVRTVMVGESLVEHRAPTHVQQQRKQRRQNNTNKTSYKLQHRRSLDEVEVFACFSTPSPPRSIGRAPTEDFVTVSSRRQLRNGLLRAIHQHT